MRFITLLLSAAIAVAARADGAVTLPRTSVRQVTAKANGVDYRLYVSLPRDYETSKERYPVVYVLDADYSFAIAHNVVEHLADRRHLPWAMWSASRTAASRGTASTALATTRRRTR